MEARPIQTADVPADGAVIDWESFYRNFRKPGYIPGFEIVTKLGGGMFGLVFKARKESIGKDYAIKFLKVDDATVRAAVARELEAVRYFAQIDHPNLVSIEDLGSVDGIPYLVMNFAGQETLRHRIEAGRIEREEALRIFVQAARGVQALHEHSLVHFDLKPANIFLKGDIARVGDYGLSKLVTQSRNSLSFGRGTPYYMAPELLQRRGDARSDVYSLGVILYECLCGEVPFRGDSEWEVLRKHEVEAPAFPEWILAADRRVIERCLAKDPPQRFQSAAELLRALQAPVGLGESLWLGREGAGPSHGPAVATTGPREAPSQSPSSPPPVSHSCGRAGDDRSGERDAAASPYGLPWRQELPARGVLAAIVAAVFRLFELVILVVLLPVRGISLVVGRGASWLLRLPIRLLGATVRLLGYLLVAALVLLLVMGALALFTAV